MLVLEGEIWISGDRIIKAGRLLIEDGKIAAVGENIEVPEGAEVRTFNNGEKILPGFVEPHCHLGVYEEITGVDNLNVKNQLSSPDYSVREHINFNNIGFYESALTGGVTTACILPGSASLIAGLGSVVKTVGSNEILSEDCCLKLALGENVTKDHDVDRAGMADLLNSYFENVKIGDMPVRVHCHDKEDIKIALELSKRFNLNLVLEHLTEGHMMTDEIKDSGVKAITGPFFVGRPKKEMANPDRGLTKKLLDAGVFTCFMTDYPSNPPEMLRLAMLEVIKNGVPKMKALDMITIDSARLLGVDARVGSLEPGKDADIVIHSQSPFDYDDSVLEVYEKGVRITWPDTF